MYLLLLNAIEECWDPKNNTVNNIFKIDKPYFDR